ncbi:retrovirus-related pol polyprotein from transposon TNT 1-94 [Tanacetum coccineum]
MLIRRANADLTKSNSNSRKDGYYWKSNVDSKANADSPPNEPPRERPKGHNTSDTNIYTSQLWSESNKFYLEGTILIRTIENDVLRASSLLDLVLSGSENRPPMLNKENYVPWLSRLLRYAKSRPKENLIYDYIMNGPYVRRMIPEPVQNPGVQNVGNQNGLIVVPGIANQNPNGNGNIVAARAEGNANGNNGNQIRCYNCRGLGHLARNCTVRPRRRDALIFNSLMIAQKEEAETQAPI